jgi:conjugal transfer mating pair stabilization protein TraG
MAVEIYTLWNANQVKDLLNNIVLIVGDDSYVGLIKTVAMLGVLGAFIAGILQWRAEISLMSIITITMMHGLLLVPKVDVDVIDEGSATVYTVANVPIGVGMPASALSQIGHWLTMKFETAFSPTDAEKFTHFGMAGPQRVSLALSQLEGFSAEYKDSLNKFSTDCIMPELIETPSKATALRQAPDVVALMATTGWLNIARYVTYDIGAGPVTEDCPTALASLSDEFDSNQLTLVQNALSLKLSKDIAGAAGISGLSTYVTTAVGSTDGALLKAGATSSAILKQAAIGFGIQQPLGTALNYSVASANMSTAMNYETMTVLGEQALPKLRNGIEFIILASFPLMFLIIMVSGSHALAVMKTYFVALIWVQLWAPLYAVVNYLHISSDADPYSLIVSTLGGLSIQSWQMIGELGPTSQQTAGILTVAVPVIALMMAKGGEMAMSGMVSTVMGPMSGASTGSSSSAAAGNYGSGNVSFDNVNTGNTVSGNMTSGSFAQGNYNANQASSGSKMDVGNSFNGADSTAMVGSGTTTGGGATVNTMNGTVTGMSGAPGVQVAQTASTGANGSLSNFSGTSTEAKQSTSSGFDIGSSASFGREVSSGTRAQLMTALSTALGQSGASQVSSGASSTTSAQSAQSSGSSAGATESFGIKSNGAVGGDVSVRGVKNPEGGAGGGAGGGGGQPGTWDIKGGAGVAVRGNTGFEASSATQLAQTATDTSGATTAQQRSSAAQKLNSALDSVMASDTSQGVKDAAKQMKASFGQAVSQATTQNASVGESSNAGSRHESGSANTVGTSISSNRPGIDAAREQAGLPATPAGYISTMNQMGANPGGAVGPVLSAGQASNKSAESKGFLSGGDVGTPSSPSDVKAQGNAAVAANHAAGEGKVAAANSSNTGKVNAANKAQGTTPGQPVDTKAAHDAHDSAGKAAGGKLNSLGESADKANGVASVASQLFAGSQGTSTAASNAFLGGFGNMSPQEQQSVVARQASSDPKMAAIVKAAAANGGKLTPEQLDTARQSVNEGRGDLAGFLANMRDKASNALN